MTTPGKPQARGHWLREALEALEWARREVLRVNAPDQMRNGIRERRVQQLCRQLLREKHF